MWQQTHEKLSSGRANDWPYQGVASSPLVEGNTLYYTSNRGVVWCLDVNGFRDGKNDGPGHRREADRPERRRRHLVVRHDGGGRVVPAQHVELVAGHLGRPGVRQHVERAGREPRAHSLAEGARDHRAQQEHRQAGVGRQLGRRPHPPRPVVHAVGRQDRRRRSGGERAGRRLGARLRGGHRQEAVGVRHEPEGFGLAEDPQRGDRHAGDLRGQGLHRQRPGSGARRRRRPPLLRSTPPSAATSRSRAASGTSTRSADRSRRRPSPTACSTSPTSAASCTASTRRRARSTGRTTCSPPSGARRWSSTARCTSATRTATSSSCRRARRRRCSPR